MEKNNSSSLKRKSRNSTRSIAITIVVMSLITVGAYFAWPKSDAVVAIPALQTAKVRIGDLIITASGAGTVIPSAQVDLAFRTGGTVSELNVAVGDTVQRGQTLARLEESAQANADFLALFSDAGLANAEVAVTNAQDTLDDGILNLKYLLGSDAYYWNDQMKQAEETINDPTASPEQKTQAQTTFDQAHKKYEYFLGLHIRSLEDDGVFVTEKDISIARANLESARVTLQDAQVALEIIQTGPEAPTSPIITMGPQTEELEQARLAIESARLVAPFDGTITSLNAVLGETVGTSTIMSIATVQDLLVRFYLDETDLGKANIGTRVTFLFDAYPDMPMEGEVIGVEPAIQIVDDTPVVVVWAKLTDKTDTLILSGMTVEVEVIAAEARNVLLVPVQALRELAPGSYAVFVVQADGTLKMTPVTVGLRDYANAEILSGLNVGDVVSTGTVETK